MNFSAARYAIAATVLCLCLWACCDNCPQPPDPVPVMRVAGIYEGAAAGEAETGGSSEDREGAQVEAYALADNGSQTLVAGGAQQLTTDAQGAFEIPLFTAVKNLVISITKNSDRVQCVLIGIGQAAAQRRLHQETSSADNATEFAIVNEETDLEAAMVLSEVAQSNIPPAQVNTQDIDESIDPDLARDLRKDRELRDCVVTMLTKGRTAARELFIDILEDQTINQNSVANAEQIVRAAVERIEALRRETRRKIYELKTTPDNGTDAKIKELLEQQRQQVLAIFTEAGIPPQLYMKASLIAQSLFERFIFKIGPVCAPGQLAIGNKLIRRMLIRRVQEDAQQTITVLRNMFGYDNTTSLESARSVCEEALMSIDPEQDGGLAHGSALRDFYAVVVSGILTAVDDRLVPDQAIVQVLETMKDAQPRLKSDLQAAQDVEAVKAAYLDYFGVFREAVQRTIPIAPDEPENDRRLKKALIDLLFSISTH